jgi:hypothetical protein
MSNSCAESYALGYLPYQYIEIMHTHKFYARICSCHLEVNRMFSNIGPVSQSSVLQFIYLWHYVVSNLYVLSTKSVHLEF